MSHLRRSSLSHMPSVSRGLYAKYEVTKDGEQVDGCFVLRPDRDPAARVALLAYAAATDDLNLSEDLNRWVAAIQDALGPDERASMIRSVYEEAVAHATRQAVRARREAEERELVLEHAQRSLARLNDRSALDAKEDRDV